MNPESPCPSCGYVRQSTDQHVHEGLCPNCGIAYQKWRDKSKHLNEEPSLDPVQSSSRQSPRHSFSSLANVLLSAPESVSTPLFYGRLFILIVFSVWGMYFIVGGIDWQRIGGSFLHSVILPFHEFGHVLFIPFGQFMAILGGSLFQVAMPLALMFAFSLKNKDNFAAGLMLWWCGQSFIDISPYILDARYRALPLISGNESGHDWGNLLTMTNSLDKTELIAYSAFYIGSGLILVSIAWMGFILYKIKKQGLV